MEDLSSFFPVFIFTRHDWENVYTLQSGDAVNRCTSDAGLSFPDPTRTRNRSSRHAQPSRAAESVTVFLSEDQNTYVNRNYDSGSFLRGVIGARVGTCGRRDAAALQGHPGNYKGR